jgi:PKD repeat protein
VRTAVPALVVLMLALFPAGAQARAWTISYQPQTPVAGEEIAFHAERVNPGNGDGDSLVWDFGDAGTGATADATHVYAAGGEYTVTLTTAESGGSVTLEDSVVVQVGPAPPPPNTPPSAAFTFSPASPLVGESVLFTGGSDPDGDPITREWHFGDLTPASSEVAPSHEYAAAGSYTAALTVTDDRGGFASTSQTLTVAPQVEAPPPDDPGGGSTPGGGSQPSGTPPSPDYVLDDGSTRPKAVPVRMKPFPVVRIAGVVLPNGVVVRILSVRAPRGTRTVVRCAGRGCPAASMARRSATRVVRFRRLERRLWAGVTLQLFVRKGGFIGKYTRFVIRAGKAPSRVDRCLMPGRSRPVRCR